MEKKNIYILYTCICIYSYICIYICACVYILIYVCHTPTHPTCLSLGTSEAPQLTSAQSQQQSLLVMQTKLSIQTQLVYPLQLACKVNSNLPSGCWLTTATGIFQPFNLLLSQSHKLTHRMQLRLAVLRTGCFLSLWGKSLVRGKSSLSFQLPRHFMLKNCEREVANHTKSLFMARAGPRPPDGPCFSHAAGPLAEVLNNQG